MTSKRLSEKSGLLDIAGRNRGRTEGDEILSIASTLLEIREHVEELYKEIAGLTLFKHDEEFVPVAIGFRNPEKVEELQERITSLQSVAMSLETVVAGLEERFRAAGRGPMGAGDLDNLINEIAERPNEIARAISRRASALLQANPTASLASVWADETLQVLEVSKTEAIIKSKEELKGLVALKDSLQPEIALGRKISTGYKYPGRVLSKDQAEGAFAAMPITSEV
jgi:hypothetical protein